jgi:hypothetical protein
MYQPINQVRLRGFLTESARLFVSRSGQPRITFRMEVWIDDESLPAKKPAGVDYFSVVAFGTDFIELLPQLGLEREITLAGGRELTAVIRAKELRMALLLHGALQHDDYVVGANRRGNMNCEIFAGEFI